MQALLIFIAKNFKEFKNYKLGIIIKLIGVKKDIFAKKELYTYLKCH